MSGIKFYVTGMRRKLLEGASPGQGFFPLVSPCFFFLLVNVGLLSAKSLLPISTANTLPAPHPTIPTDPALFISHLVTSYEVLPLLIWKLLTESSLFLKLPLLNSSYPACPNLSCHYLEVTPVRCIGGLHVPRYRSVFQASMYQSHTGFCLEVDFVAFLLNFSQESQSRTTFYPMPDRNFGEHYFYLHLICSPTCFLGCRAHIYEK